MGSRMAVDASTLKAIGRGLKKSTPEVYVSIRAAVREQARKVAGEARQNSSWSTRIPATVRIRNFGLTGVIIQAGGPDAPHAKPYENSGRVGEFRHPVFPETGDRGSWTWVSEAARPFLHPAGFAHMEDFTLAIVEAVSSVVREVTKKAEKQTGQRLL